MNSQIQIYAVWLSATLFTELSIHSTYHSSFAFVCKSGELRGLRLHAHVIHLVSGNAASSLHASRAGGGLKTLAIAQPHMFGGKRLRGSRIKSSLD